MMSNKQITAFKFVVQCISMLNLRGRGREYGDNNIRGCRGHLDIEGIGSFKISVGHCPHASAATAQT